MRKWILVLAVSLVGQTATAQEIVLRHALGGAGLDALATLVLRFNDEQKGKAKITLQDLSGVADRRQLPHLALLDDDDARLFFDSRPRFKPMVDVMKEGGQKFDTALFLPQIVNAVTDLKGRPQALPMALALPVLFYNKDAFSKAGLDPAVPPRTWWETQQAAGKLFDAGYACPLTTSRFVRVHLENLSSQHSQPVVSKSGGADRFVFNNLIQIKHVALLASWQKSRYFHYFGPGREGDAKFLSGECAMLTGESALHADLKGASFSVGVAGLPYYEDVFGVQPANVLPDGGALWALPGKKKDDYKVMARFVAFLMRPPVQREWVRATGFLPMTAGALDELAAAGVSRTLIDAARKRLSMSTAKQGDSRMHSGLGRNRVRELLDEEIEFVWKNTKPAKEALDTAMRRANAPAP
jgi:sn-glycerol 3-phosphate transport system substrate-binding protein